MKRIYFDLETLPATDADVVAQIKANVKPPGNIKNPESIAKWLDNPDNLEDAVRKTSFSGALGQILCIGYAIDDGEVQVAKGGPGKEREALEEFLAVVREGNFSNQNMLVGHNNIKFDNKFLSQRMMINGLGPLFPFNAKPWEAQTEDTMQMFCGNYDTVSLANLCLALGIPTPKDDIDGSQVYDVWLEGGEERIFEYCKKDVDRTRRVHRALSRRAA